MSCSPQQPVNGKRAGRQLRSTELAIIWKELVDNDGATFFPSDFKVLVETFISAIEEGEAVFLQSLTKQVLVKTAWLLEHSNLPSREHQFAMTINIVARDKAVEMIFQEGEDVTKAKRNHRLLEFMQFDKDTEQDIDKELQDQIVNALGVAVYQRGVLVTKPPGSRKNPGKKANKFREARALEITALELELATQRENLLLLQQAIADNEVKLTMLKQDLDA